MRTRLIVQVGSFAVIVAVGALWMESRAVALGLQARVAALTASRQRAARALEQQRDRLLAALSDANRLRSAEASAVSPVAARQASPIATTSLLVLGEWRSSREWRNEGQSTARGTVATLLWAAAGGDVNALTSILTYDDESRRHAQALFDALPSARRTFPNAEALVASLTIQALPEQTAQLSWFHERDPDHATVGLLLKPADKSASTGTRAIPAEDNNPPMLSDNGAMKFTVLSLERSSLGWRVVIPVWAVDRLAVQLNKPTS